MILKILVGVNYCAACFRGHCFSMEGGRRQDGGGAILLFSKCFLIQFMCMSVRHKACRTLLQVDTKERSRVSE